MTRKPDYQELVDLVRRADRETTEEELRAVDEILAKLQRIVDSSRIRVRRRLAAIEEKKLQLSQEESP